MLKRSCPRSFLTAPAVAIIATVGTLFASITPAAADAITASAVQWIGTQQQTDGGFEVSGFPGFETPDAVLAIAEQAQTTAVWDTTTARAAVAAHVKSGKTPLDYLDDYAEGKAGGPLNAGQAAKLIVVARALGYEPAAFDPQSDGPSDLVTVLGSPKPDGSFGAFNATLFVAIADRLSRSSDLSATAAYIDKAQQANGGWNFAGDPMGLEGVPQIDPDTTGLALQALAAIAPVYRDSFGRGVAFLARSQLADGSWGESFAGESNPNSTAQAVLGITAAGYDAGVSCWRDAETVELRGTSYHSPLDQLRGLQAADGHIVGPFDSFGVNTSATSQTVQALLRTWLPINRAKTSTITGDVAVSVPPPCPGNGYTLFGANGAVDAFGPWGRHFGQLGGSLGQPIVGGDVTSNGRGYWMFASDGGVFSFGNAPFKGSTGNIVLNQPVVGGVGTPSGNGYWLFAHDGGVFAFGDAVFHGSTGNIRLNQPIVGGAATPSGKGYWLFAADGGVFAFGDATFRGSTGNIRLNQPVVAGASTPSGKGYWLFARDGGVFAFGDATFQGSTGNIVLNQPIAGAAAHPTDAGYWLFAADGGVFAFGRAPFKGSVAGSNRTIVGGAS